MPPTPAFQDSGSKDSGGSPSTNAASEAILKADISQFIGFEIDHRRYAFPIHQVREIVILTDITPVPQVAACVEGVANLRGSVIPVVSMRTLLGVASLPADQDTRTIVVQVAGRTIGCTVDNVSEVLRIADNQIQSAPEAIAGGGAAFIDGLVKLDEKLVVLLNVDRLLGDNDLSK